MRLYWKGFTIEAENLQGLTQLSLDMITEYKNQHPKMTFILHFLCSKRLCHPNRPNAGIIHTSMHPIASLKKPSTCTPDKCTFGLLGNLN